MMCILVRGEKGSETWCGRRSVEIIGFHREQKEVQILLTLYMDNRLGHGSNYFQVLHPGNVVCELIHKPWPLSRHPDERGAEKSYFAPVYERAFEFDNGTLCQTNGLAAWDCWFKIAKERVNIWPAQESASLLNDIGVEQLYPDLGENCFTPFTVWRFGPFTSKGPVLVAFKIYVSGDTYRELVTREQDFTVDGPIPLLARIKDKYIPRLATGERQIWYDRIEDFREYIGSGEGYDLVLVGPRFADEVKLIDSSWISEAPLQFASHEIGTRYITARPYFTMSLQYAEEPSPEAAVKKQKMGISS